MTPTATIPAIRRIGQHPQGTCSQGHVVTLLSNTVAAPAACPVLSCSTPLTWRI